MNSTENTTMLTKKRRHSDDDVIRDDNKQEKQLWDEDEEGPIIRYNILEGSMKCSDFATFCLLVPESKISDVLKGLQDSKSRMFDWTIVEDEVITDIRNIPAELTHPIRSLSEKDQLPKNKTETQLLNWLIHGESFYMKKYAIVTFLDPIFPRNNGDVVFEVSTEDLEKPFHDAIRKIYEKNRDQVRKENSKLNGFRFIDRERYLREYGNSHCERTSRCRPYAFDRKKPCVHVVDEALIESLQEWLANENFVSKWAHENREMVHGKPWVRLSQTSRYKHWKKRNERK